MIFCANSRMLTGRILYQVFIGVLLAAKLMWITSAIRLRIAKRKGEDVTEAESRARAWEILSHSLMFLLLILTFHPVNNPADRIKIGTEERLVFFVIGVMGLLHLDYSKVETLFMHNK